MPELTPEEKRQIYLEEKARIEQQFKAAPVKKKSYTGYVALVVIAIFAVVFFAQRDKFSLLSDLGSSSSSSYTSKPAPRSPESNFTLKVNKFSTDSYGYYEVIGEIRNTSTESLRFVQIKATFFNKAGAAVGEDTTYACAEDFILPSGTKAFKLSGNNQPDYHSVRCQVVDCMTVK